MHDKIRARKAFNADSTAAWLNKDSFPLQMHINTYFTTLKLIAWKQAKTLPRFQKQKGNSKPEMQASADTRGTRKEPDRDTGPTVNLAWRQFRLELRFLLETKLSKILPECERRTKRNQSTAQRSNKKIIAIFSGLWVGEKKTQSVSNPKPSLGMGHGNLS